MEPWILQSILVFGILLLLLISGISVGVAMWTIGIGAGFFFYGSSGLISTAATSFSSVAKFILAPLTLFIFMGDLLEKSGLAELSFRSMERWIGHFPGGLGIVTIGCSVLIAAATGLSPAATAMLAPVAIAPMLKRKYDVSLAVGLVSASTALAILIPPGILLVLYGSYSGVPIAKMFVGGIVPGLLTAILFALYIIILAIAKPEKVPSVRTQESLKEKIRGTVEIFPLVFIVIGVLGSIYAGIATPSEAAAVGCLCIIILLVAYKKLTLYIIKSAITSTVKTNSMIFFIIIGASYFSQVLTYIGFPEQLSLWVSSLEIPGMAVILAMLVVLIFMGCFLDAASIFFITTPIFLPIVKVLEYDLLWFGILFVITMEIANITPPVGLNLYVMKGVAPEGVTFGDIIRGVIPFWCLYLLSLILIILIPEIATWLPSHME